MAETTRLLLDSGCDAGLYRNRIRYATSRPETQIHFHFLGLEEDSGDIWGVAVYHEDDVAQAFTIGGEELDPMLIELVSDGFDTLDLRSGGAIMEVSMKPERSSLALVEDN